MREWELKTTRPRRWSGPQAHGIQVPTTKKSPYSIDDNLWGRAIECGVLEDPWTEPPADIYTMTSDPMRGAPTSPNTLNSRSRRGLPYTHQRRAR